jgi:GTP diphosphokinase / guanosine-3',5'-bis(diphosphate) 3'-diphosphatase
MYRHYKNKYYLELCESTHTETDEDLVIYQSMYDGLGIWARPRSMFYQQIEIGGKMTPRFEQVTEFKTIIADTNFIDCLKFAVRAHTGQTRKFSGLPYINHPIEVAAIIAKYCPDNNISIKAALMHDVIEDTQYTYDDILKIAGREVADVVLEVTDNQQLSKLEQKMNQINSASKKSTNAKLVKLADKLHNCSSFVSELPAGQQLTSILCFSKTVVSQMRNTNPDIENRLEILFDNSIPPDTDIDAYTQIYLESKK